MVVMVNLFHKILHVFRLFVYRHRLRNKDFSIISSNCIGGVMYHDLGLPFTSPTVNLYFSPGDFVKYIKDIRYYNSLELEKVIGNYGFPVGRLGDITLYFMHYDTFEEARMCWEKRKKRIRYDCIVVVMTDQDGCTAEDMAAFDTVSYPKIMFTNKHTGYSWCRYIRGFEGEDSVGNVIEYQGYGKRYYEQVDYVSFLNACHQ